GWASAERLFRNNSGRAAVGTPFALPVTLNVLAPAPVVKTILPSTVPLDSGATTFTVTGAGFTATSVIVDGGG
ncbi:MAG TPA: hypothetical protein VGZ73_03950, partial [Bryobacteraceae bacterium]|nr:hypothetical protein [Bryobacteraceae bacterium]